MASPERLGFQEKLAYGLGDTASNFFYQFFNLFVVFYYTDIFGLSAAVVGTMTFAVRVFDAVVDPTIGALADRTRSRWGKFRPYLLWGALPYGILGYVMFLNPKLTADMRIVYAYVTYGLMWVAYSAINIPYSALMGVMSPSSEQRTSLSTYRFICAFIGQFLIVQLVVPLKKYLGGGNEAEGVRYTMLIFAVVSVVLFLYTFARTRERVSPPAGQTGAFGPDVLNMLRNGPWMALFVSGLFTLINAAVRGGTIIYYFKYVVRDESKFTLFATCGTVAFILGAVCTRFFLQLGERRTLMIVLSVLNALCLAAFFLVDPHSYAVLVGLHVVASFVVGPTPAILWSMYADTADFGEWKFGRRATGLLFSAAVFSQKVGLAIGASALGLLLAYFGFVANAEASASTTFGIRLLFSVIPAALALLGAFAIFFYPITDAKMRMIEAELAERRAVAA
ncbi:MAG TPA: MFS transporter [Opitutaceae bacterium]|jgi:GPH family glycoside/pentoside/hexuronide:cation symporter